MAKPPSFERAVLARIPGSTETGPWIACDGRLMRIQNGRAELIDPKNGAVTRSFAHASPWIVVASGGPTLVRERERGKGLEVCGLDGVTRVRLASTGKEPFLGPRPLAISPDGSFVAGTHHGRVLWDARAGACVVAEEGSYANSATFSPDGSLVVFTHGGKPATLVEVEGWRSHPLAGSGSKGRFVEPTFSPSGRRLALVLGRKLLVVDVAARAALTEMKSTRDIFATAWLDEDTIALATRASLVVRRVGDGAELATLPVRCTALATDPAATRLLCAVDGVWAEGREGLEIVLLDVPALRALLGATPTAASRRAPGA